MKRKTLVIELLGKLVGMGFSRTLPFLCTLGSERFCVSVSVSNRGGSRGRKRETEQHSVGMLNGIGVELE